MSASISREELIDVLCCPVCRGALCVLSERKWECKRCKNTFPLLEGVPSFLLADALGSRLEEINYDEVHSIDARVISSIGTSWHNLICGLGKIGENAVEIGAGTGALTLGLLEHRTFRVIVATDISLKFLQYLRRQGVHYQELAVIACDANNLNFCDGAFGVVLGRSILHHLVDYRATLESAFRILRPGGAAIFYEPLLQGKIFIALFAKLLLEAEQKQGGKVFDKLERNKIAALVRHITKVKWYPQNRESLLKIEDKYIFDLDELSALARAIGFSEVVFDNGTEAIDVSYWNYFVRHLGVLGIKPDKVASFRWIGDSFAETYGLLFGDRMVAPMGFFIFKKRSH
jgi:ubiquinone/menaquinone biosynthesis C-methylase UbiE/uncharacterized protein YbaR (Trm112 family)